MKRNHRPSLLIPSVCLIALLPGSVQDAPEITEWIRRLGSESFEARERASEQLAALGEDALPALERAAKENPDPEIRARSAQLVRDIRCSGLWSRIRLAYRDPAGAHLVIRGGPGPVNAKVPALREIGRSFALSPDGQWLIAFDGKDVTRYELGPETGARILARDLEGDSVRLSPDGGKVLIDRLGSTIYHKGGQTDQPGETILIDSVTGETIWRREGPNGWRWLDARRLVHLGSTSARTLRIWKPLEGKEPVETVEAPLDLTAGIAPSPDGRYVAVTSVRGERRRTLGILIYDGKEKTWRRAAEEGANRYEARVWSPESMKVAYPLEGRLAVFDVSTGKETLLLEAKGPGGGSFPREQEVSDVVGWVDGRRLAFLKIHRVDTSILEKFGHGAIDFYCDLIVIDVETGEQQELTEGGPIQGEFSFSRLGDGGGR